MAKLFYKIGEVSRLAGVEPYILRYWESEFPGLAPKKNRGGQRVYLQKDLETVLLIKRMLHEEGFTIAGARKKLAELRTTGNTAKAAGVENHKPEPPAKPEPTVVQTSFPFAYADALGRFKKEIKEILDIIK